MKKFALSVFAALSLALCYSASADEAQTDARALFTRFVAAQNAHDINEVKSMLWDSPEMLFFSRGVEIRGATEVAKRFEQYYLGTWHLEPDMTKFQAATISADVVQILVPIVFTRGLPDGTPQSDPFLISQTYIKGDHGWHIASILPIANTRIK